MKEKIKEIELIHPISQIKLFGYDNYFNLFKNLYKNNKLPNVILLSGTKGIGKSTFSYHFINYILSHKTWKHEIYCMIEGNEFVINFS